MNKTKFYLILCLGIFLSCENVVKSINTSNDGLHIERFVLEKVKEISVALDSVTSPYSSMIQVINDSTGKELLTFLNNYNKSIYIYDLESATFKERIIFDTEGPDGMGKITGYHIYNVDSIFTFNYDFSIIYLTDYSGKIKDKFYVSSGNQRYLPSPKVRTGSPIIYDAYQDVYYRIAWHPNIDFDPDDQKSRAKVVSIILLDNNFNKIGEKVLPKLMYAPDQLFIGKNGLYIMNYPKSGDKKVFSQFIMKPILPHED